MSDEEFEKIYREALSWYEDEDYYRSQRQKFLSRYSNHWQGKITRIFRLAPDLAGLTVLDVGCGVGTYALEASLRGAQLAIGIDITYEMVHQGSDLARTQSGMEGARFIDADVTAIPFCENCFDCLIASDIVEHLPDPVLTRMLLECFRVLTPGGRLVLHTYPTKYDYIFFQWRYLVFFLPGLILSQPGLDRYIEWVDRVPIQLLTKLKSGRTRDENIARASHCNTQTLRGLLQMAEICGFLVEEAFVESTYGSYKTNWLRRFAGRLFRLSDYTERNIYVLAKKE